MDEEEPAHQSLARRLGFLRPTRIRLAAAVAVALVIVVYAWGIFLHKDSGGDEADVEWLQVDLPFAAVDEAQHPYAGSLIGSTEDVWRTYVVEGDETPRMVLESNRLSQTLIWSGDGREISVYFLSQAVNGEPLTGMTAASTKTGDIVWQRVFDLSVQPIPSGGAERLALLDRRAGVNGALYLAERDGTGRRLYARWAFTGGAGSWSPDGNWLLLGSSGGTPAQDFGTYFAVSTNDGKAMRVGSFKTIPTWSPDSGTIAAFDGADVVIFDLRMKQRKTIDLGGGVTGTAGQPIGRITRSSDGRYVIADGALIESDSGRIVSPPEPGVSSAVVSLDGKWLAMSSNCRSSSTLPISPSSSPNRMVVKDVSTGRKVMLLDCLDGLYSYQKWLTTSTLLLVGNRCLSGCTSPVLDVALVSMPAGDLRRLNRPDEDTTAVAFAPDGQRILVGGRAIRIFSIDGELLRLIPVPDGLIVTTAAWSRDGRAFAYIVGPRITNASPSRSTP